MDAHTRTVKPGTVVGFCNPLLDMTVVGNADLLKRYDLKNNDAILAGKRQMGIYEELEKDPDVQYTAGGSGQNSLRVVQWILNKPNCAAFFGAVGEDRYSKILEREAINDGLDVKYQYHSDKSTGTCAVIITNGGKDRSLCANLSASRNYTDDQLEIPENKKIVENAKFYLVTGFFLISHLSTVEKISRIAHKRNCPLLFNMSAAYIFELYMDSVMAVLPYVNIMVGSTEEAKAFALANKWDTTDMESVARKMSVFKVKKDGYRLVILTQAEKPVIVAMKDLVSTFNVPEISAEDIVDTNGAGDAFVGAFIAKYVLGYPLKSCIQSGINAGCYIIKQHGMTRGDTFDVRNGHTKNLRSGALLLRRRGQSISSVQLFVFYIVERGGDLSAPPYVRCPLAAVSRLSSLSYQTEKLAYTYRVFFYEDHRL